LNRIITRCLEKNPRDRFQTARDVYNELRYVKRELDSGMSSPESPPAWTAPPGIATPSPVSPAPLSPPPVSPLPLATPSTAPGTTPPRDIPSIAVLPFVN